MSEPFVMRRSLVAVSTGAGVVLTRVDFQRSLANPRPDDAWVDAILKVLDTAGSPCGVVAIEVDGSANPGAIGRTLAQDLDALRGAKLTHSFSFVANAVDLDEDRLVRLATLDGFDIALNNPTPLLLEANIKGLLRMISSASTIRSQPAKVAASARLLVGGWAIDLARKHASHPNGSSAKLSELEMAFIRRLAEKERPSGNADLMVGDIRETSVRPSAVVHKIRKKLGKDFPIVSLGGDDYRIDLDP